MKMDAAGSGAGRLGRGAGASDGVWGAAGGSAGAVRGAARGAADGADGAVAAGAPCGGRADGAARTNPRAGAEAPRGAVRGGMSIIRRACIAPPLRARASIACPGVAGVRGALLRPRAGRSATSLTTSFFASF